MPDNNYTSDPPAATAGQLIAISDSIALLRKDMEKLTDVPQKMDRISMQFDQLQEKQQLTETNLHKFREGLEDDLERTKTTLRAEIKQIKLDSEVKYRELDLQIRPLNEGKTKIENFTNIVKLGGLTLAGSLWLGWSNQTAKTDAVSTQTLENSQKIQVLEKQGDQTIRILEEIRNKFYNPNYTRPQP